MGLLDLPAPFFDFVDRSLLGALPPLLRLILWAIAGRRDLAHALSFAVAAAPHRDGEGGGVGRHGGGSTPMTAISRPRCR
jgi:hypothetical protein